MDSFGVQHAHVVADPNAYTKKARRKTMCTAMGRYEAFPDHQPTLTRSEICFFQGRQTEEKRQTEEHFFGALSLVTWAYCRNARIDLPARFMTRVVSGYCIWIGVTCFECPRDNKRFETKDNTIDLP